VNDDNNQADTGKLVGRVVELAGLVEYQEGSVVSRTVIDKDTGTVTLFAFDQGQGLSEHTTPFDALGPAVQREDRRNADNARRPAPRPDRRPAVQDAAGNDPVIVQEQGSGRPLTGSGQALRQAQGKRRPMLPLSFVGAEVRSTFRPFVMNLSNQLCPIG